ncbi:hypothetical protein H5410_054920 [Solanum commersonii]|uniref:Uncharacterized protein n=1 Tax=Solanum commersonii TaxID=4109 RepID=A0A9J5WGP3_SOLCO|nr:hypothetical protein H5410_054920 [Solanum commersonii]
MAMWIEYLHSSDGTEQNKVRVYGVGKRVESIRRDDLHKQNKIRIWLKKIKAIDIMTNHHR